MVTFAQHPQVMRILSALAMFALTSAQRIYFNRLLGYRIGQRLLAG